MTARRGFMLVSVLLITMILLTLGLTFLGKRAIQYRRAALYEHAARARSLAESGLDEALAKLRRDIEFPPLSKDQSSFSYVEEIEVGGERIGSYRVTMDGSRRFVPYSVWVITSQGESGPDARNPAAIRTLRCEVDVYPNKRTQKSVPNPYFYDVINFEDLGGL